MIPNTKIGLWGIIGLSLVILGMIVHSLFSSKRKGQRHPPQGMKGKQMFS